eukprot:3747846-Rhodomonas_salina.1
MDKIEEPGTAIATTMPYAELRYAICGTHIAYGATQCAVLSWRMVALGVLIVGFEIQAHSIDHQ